MSVSFTCHSCKRTESPMRHSLGCNGVYRHAGSGYTCTGCGDFWQPSGRAWCAYCGGWTSNYSTDPPVNSCFPGEVPVLTPRGQRRIAEIEVGAKVLSYDTATRRFLARPVTRVLVHPASRVWEVDFASRRKPLRTTAYHTFLTERGWVRTDRLRAGDRLVAEGGADPRILRVVESSVVEPVYNLVTAGEHTFVAGGVVAHNFTFLRSARTLLHSWLLDRLPAAAPLGTGARLLPS
ncbi:MAG: Hint domain-containing protein [Pseudomonadota bacterium]|nr:Hint domain-containing protein [Pseudomonadota bacterium]